MASRNKLSKVVSLQLGPGRDALVSTKCRQDRQIARVVTDRMLRQTALVSKVLEKLLGLGRQLVRQQAHRGRLWGCQSHGQLPCQNVGNKIDEHCAHTCLKIISVTAANGQQCHLIAGNSRICQQLRGGCSYG